MGISERMNKKATSNQCQFVKGTGERCRAKHLAGSKLCFFHDPAKVSEREAACRKGGHSRKMAALPKDAADFEIKKADDVVRLLSVTINQVRKGEIDPRVANAVGYLSGIILRAREQGDIDQRLKQVEQIVLNKGIHDVTGFYTSAQRS